MSARSREGGTPSSPLHLSSSVDGAVGCHQILTPSRNLHQHALQMPGLSLWYVNLLPNVNDVTNIIKGTQSKS